MTKQQISLSQGQDDAGRTFGYVCGEDGGFFFTWMPTLEATLNSVEEDEVDGDGDLDRDEVVEYLREYLPATRRGHEMWGNDEE